MNFNRFFTIFFVLFFLLIAFQRYSFAGTPNVTVSDCSNNLKIVNASMIVNSDVASVWKVITDYSSFTTFMPGIKQWVMTGNNSAKIKLDVSGLIKPFVYEANINQNESSKTITLTRISGDFNYLKAVYSLKSVNNGTKTLISYTLQVDHGKKIPDIFVKGALKNNVVKTLNAVEKESLKVFKIAVAQ